MLDYLNVQPNFNAEPFASTYVAPSSAHGTYKPYTDTVLIIQSRAAGRKVEPIGDVYVADFRAKKKIPSTSETISVTDVVNTVKDVFGLNNVQIADLVGVSRPSLYNHLSGKEDPKSMDEYLKIWQLAVDVRGAVPSDIKAGLKSILVNGKTLLTHLKDGERSQVNIISICQQIADKLLDVGTRTPSASEQKRAVRSHSTMA